MINNHTKSGTDRVLLLLGLCGVLSPVFLAIATLAGGALRPGYDPVANSISELYEAGAPNAVWLMALLTTYHALVIPLAIGIHRGLPGARFGWTGPVFLALAGLLGIPLGAYARCDPGCFGATTFRGQLHGILVLVTVVLIFSAMFATWLRARSYAHWRSYARYTLGTAVSGVLFGVAMMPYIQGEYSGLLERIAVAIVVQWYVITGLRLIAVSRGHELFDNDS